MSGPLSGIGQQPASLAQSTQNVANDQVRAIRNEEDVPKENNIQPREAALASSNESNESSNSVFQKNLNDISISSDSNKNQPRGSVVDVVV